MQKTAPVLVGQETLDALQVRPSAASFHSRLYEYDEATGRAWPARRDTVLFLQRIADPGAGQAWPGGWDPKRSGTGVRLGCTWFSREELLAACDASLDAAEGRPHDSRFELSDGSLLRVRADGSVERRSDPYNDWTVCLYADLADAFAKDFLGRDPARPFAPVAAPRRDETSTPWCPQLRGYTVERTPDAVRVGCVEVRDRAWNRFLTRACAGRPASVGLGAGGFALAALGRVLLWTPAGIFARFRAALLSRREVLQLAEHTGVR